MSCQENHIPFGELEREDEIDRSHLATCQDCQKGLKISRFLHFQMSSAPRIDPPSFFASKIARRIESVKLPFLMVVQRAAQQLIPVFLALIICTGLLLYQLSRQEPPVTYLHSDLIFDESVQKDISLEYVIDSLREPSGETSSFEQP